MFPLQLFSSFLIGGILVALMSLFSEKVPLRWKSAVLTIPSTMAITFFFIGLTKSPADVADAAIISPATLGISYVYMFLLARFSRHGFAVGMGIALIFLFIFSFLILKFPPVDFSTSIFIYAIPMIFFSFLLTKNIERKKDLLPISLGLKLILVRSLIAGTVIATGVFFSHTIGNMWGGFFSTFPAATTSLYEREWIHKRIEKGRAAEAIITSTGDQTMEIMSRNTEHLRTALLKPGLLNDYFISAFPELDLTYIIDASSKDKHWSVIKIHSKEISESYTSTIRGMLAGNHFPENGKMLKPVSCQ